MDIVNLIIGIVLLIISAVVVICCIKRTPINLRTWYGVMFGICSLTGIIAGIVFIVRAFI